MEPADAATVWITARRANGGFMRGDGKGILDAEAGWQQMMTGLLRVLMRGSAGLGVGAGSSLEACVMADELIGVLRAMMRGVVVDEETLAVDVIREIGPGGGTFLGNQHTFRHFRERWQPTVAPGLRYEDWLDGGRKTTLDRVREKLREIVRTHEPAPIPGSARTAIDGIIACARARVQPA